ncbi:MAG: ATP-binding protein [Geobacteraceae bacterium]|nr:ATP-binding protein [Geobacteraceae bacterium]
MQTVNSACMLCIIYRFLSAVFIKTITRTRLSAITGMTVFFCFVTVFTAVAADNPKVLVLHSYHSGFEWTDSMNSAIIKSLRSAYPEGDVFVEYMNTKRVPLKVMSPMLRRNYATLYRNAGFNAIITTDNNALDFMLKYGDELFPGVPVVFCGINNFDDYNLGNRRNYTGVREDFDTGATLDIMLRFHPDTHAIAMIADVTESSQITLAIARNVAKAKKYGKIRFVELSGLSETVLADKLEKLEKGTIILLLSYYRSPEGRVFSVKDGTQLIQKHTQLPVYALWDFYMLPPVIGGKIVTGTLQGQAAGEIAIRILKGEKPEKIAPYSCPTSYYFNYDALQKFNIPDSLIPDGSIVAGRPDTFYSRYKTYIRIGAAFALSLIVTILILLRSIVLQQRNKEELRRMNERFVLATHAARVGVWDWDIPNNELVWDDSMYRLYGIQTGDFGGAYDAWACTIHPQDKAHTEAEIQAALRGEREYAPEFRIVRPDGTIRYIKADSQTFRDEGGNPLRMIGTNIDISELKLAEEELRTLNAELEERVLERTRELLQAKEAAEAANRAKSIFLANMSHELRTPLNTIIGFSDILQRDPAISGSLRETLGIIKKSGDHLLGLINDVLDIAKIESGRIELELKPFDLGAMVLDVTDLLSIRAANKGLRLLLDQSSTFPRYIVGDETKLRQVLINLISNAIKATEQGSVTVRLRVKQNHAAHLIMEVEDTGCGIAPEDQGKLFQPFVQVGPQGNQQGTGLGLAITRQFAELMGGSIFVTSSAGRGSIFRVEVVVQLVNPEDITQASAEQGDVTGLEPGQPAFRVLVVEDQQDNRILLMNLLEKAGFQARMAENGVGAVEQFTTWKPHFIWMDQRMPVMDGVEATRRIRGLPGGNEVKIAVVTASAFREEDAELTMAGFDAIVHKPYRPAQIFNCMERLLGVRYVRAEAEAMQAAHHDLSGAELDAVPDSLRLELDEALLFLDSERILQAIDKIGRVAPELAAALGKLAHNYDYTGIREALHGRRSS